MRTRFEIEQQLSKGIQGQFEQLEVIIELLLDIRDNFEKLNNRLRRM